MTESPVRLVDRGVVPPTDDATRARKPLLIVLVAILVSAGLVYQASTAAFTATTQNPGNSWQAGTVVLADDDSGAALFTATGLTPSSTDQHCIAVQYSGDVPATVALYGTASGTLAPYLNLTVETGTGGSFSSGSACTGFSAGATIYTGTLANFAATRTNFSNGAPTAGRWAPTGTATLVYRFSYTITNDPAADGTSATATFTWEAQSS